jgi:hypothetical protein
MKYQQTMSIFLLLLIFSSISLTLSERKPNKKRSKNQHNSNIILKTKPSYYPETNFVTTIYSGNTPLQKTDDLAINYLDRHHINCYKDHSAINMFKLKSFRDKKIQFSYFCVHSPMISTKCRNYQTVFGDTSFNIKNTIDSLVKHYVECPSNTVMKSFKLDPKGNFESGRAWLTKLRGKNYPQVSYKYTCCEAKIERTIWATTNRTFNTKNTYIDLKRQKIDAHDFNAISSFHMQCPQRTMYYELRISQLKGETSPFYPDYLKDNSNNPGENLQSTLNAKEKNTSKPAFVGKYYLSNYFLNFFTIVILELSSKLSKILKRSNKKKNKTKVYLPAVVLYRQ